MPGEWDMGKMREEAARRAYELLQESYRDTFLARSLEKMV